LWGCWYSFGVCLWVTDDHAEPIVRLELRMNESRSYFSTITELSSLRPDHTFSISCIEIIENGPVLRDAATPLLCLVLRLSPRRTDQQWQSTNSHTEISLFECRRELTFNTSIKSSGSEKIQRSSNGWHSWKDHSDFRCIDDLTPKKSYLRQWQFKLYVPYSPSNVCFDTKIIFSQGQNIREKYSTFLGR
jgi:hypothetical protein